MKKDAGQGDGALKLSMWMIANQISELDIKLEIREEAPAVLNSARLAYATNCVHIYREQDYVVCDGEGDRILFYDMEITRVFELVQSIFDAHEDWISSIQEAAERQDYQKAMDIAYKLFKNPMVLFDANNKVLGRTSVYGEHALDSEWAYLSRYGYSSVNAVNMMRYHSGNSEFYSHNKVNYQFSQNHMITIGGITFCLYFNHMICGRINLIAKERRLNQGDAQLLQKLIEVLQPAMGQSLVKDPLTSTSSVFLNVMIEKPYDPMKLEMQMKYMGWKEQDTFYVTLIRFTKEEKQQEVLERQENSLMQLLIQNLTDASIYTWKGDLVILSVKNLAQEYNSQMLLRNLVVHNPVRIGFSLPDQNGICEISRFYRQAVYALERGAAQEKPKSFQYFETYAVEYLLTARVSAEDKMVACMPSVLRLWKKKQHGDEMFRTMLCFLDHERSIAQTSAELYLHRNTMVYRMKKIQESMNIDLNDPFVRKYCYISMHFLDALEKIR